MANTVGGWLLLGVSDQREIVGFELPARTDFQSYLGNLLRNAVDPVPPFLADTLEVDGEAVGYIKVFPASTLVLVVGAGAVYTRDDGGKRPIGDHRSPLELARRGQASEEEARTRGANNALSNSTLGVPGPQSTGMVAGYTRAIVRAAPLSITSQLVEWPISAGAPATCLEAATRLAVEVGPPVSFSTVQPYGRAVLVRAAPLVENPSAGQWQSSVFADCAGVFGAMASHRWTSPITLDQ